VTLFVSPPIIPFSATLGRFFFSWGDDCGRCAPFWAREAPRRSSDLPLIAQLPPHVSRLRRVFFSDADRTHVFSLLQFLFLSACFFFFFFLTSPSFPTSLSYADLLCDLVHFGPIPLSSSLHQPQPLTLHAPSFSSPMPSSVAFFFSNEVSLHSPPKLASSFFFFPATIVFSAYPPLRS